jgi:tRNA uridine 5-carboxymethylaminomethyl modification enzyme
MTDVIVVGGGHAGCEAALAAARMGMDTILCSLDLNWMASMPCNPSVGGPAKGIVVREIDALGGQMGKTADATALQFKMLNSTKGPGVRSLRVQSDKLAYKALMQETVLHQENLTVLETMVTKVLVEHGRVYGVQLSDGTVLPCRALILTTGVYMASKVMVSDVVKEQGPDQQKTTGAVSQSLRDLGLTTMRLKTGTPPRIKTQSIDFSYALLQPGTDESDTFSYETKQALPLSEQVPCHLIYTTDETLKIIRANLHRSSMYSGVVKGVGPRYCPSIEDKVVRFADKPRHQLFLEPESLSMDTTYLQGFSTSMPYEVQEQMVRSLPGFRDCVIDKYAYAIEYDAIDPLQLKPTLELKAIGGLFCAGQINGTSGYEEAAGQGLVAGINAAAQLKGLRPLVLRRNEAYIGVMIDDLVTKGTREPYRLLTSRAEYRLLLRHDNADQRLTAYGHYYGLISEDRWQRFCARQQRLEQWQEKVKTTHVPASEDLTEYLARCGYSDDGRGTLQELLKRPGVEMEKLAPILGLDVDRDLARELDIVVKYQGYIAKAQREADHLDRMENVRLPADLDYAHMDQLALEARQKLAQVRPLTLGQASRISGVNPSDIMVLSIWLKQQNDHRS